MNVANPPIVPATENTGPQAIVTLFLLLANAVVLQGVIEQIKADDRISAPNIGGDMLALASPTFTLLCILVIWIIAKRGTAYNKIFRITGIISILIYAGWLGLMMYVVALGKAFAH